MRWQNFRLEMIENRLKLKQASMRTHIYGIMRTYIVV